MKIHNSQINTTISNVNSQSLAILVYGTDYGLISEKIADLKNAYFKNKSSNQLEKSVIEFNCHDIMKEPQLLFDEANSISLFSAKKIIKINNANDSINKILESYFEKSDPESLLLLQSDSLGPSSTLRKLFENHRTAKIIACYSDDIESIDSLVGSMLKNENISIEPDAKTAFVEKLGLDRLVTKTEIEKAILFSSPGGHLNYQDIMSFVGDQTSINLEKLSDAALLGDFKSTLNILARLEKEDTQSLQIIKVLLRQLQTLYHIKISVINKLNIDNVINNFKPTIYFKRKPHINKQTRFWSVHQIIKALKMLSKAERECKSSGTIQKTIARQVIISLCLLASKNKA